MRVKVAVVTVQGKAYFHIVNLLKEKDIAFFSLMPNESIPAGVKVVITTPEEQYGIVFDKILTFTCEEELDSLMSQVTISLHGKERYERMVIGVDPGEVTGLIVIADGKVLIEANCLSIQETSNKIKSILKNVNLSATKVRVKIGNGVPAYRELIGTLDKALDPKIVLDVVSEVGTNLPISKRSRSLRHIISATRISTRVGCIYQRSRKE
ncbi:MAG: hypothetical protein FWF66_04965 [Candidatus Bathyarchaeota archaeon]|nr:hypothetical protein [Candidatus Termiticorpusculum sp.]MCL1970787.1 hypothetical protein [Candidatus Termiticorpusculum sp.]